MNFREDGYVHYPDCGDDFKGTGLHVRKLIDWVWLRGLNPPLPPPGLGLRQDRGEEKEARRGQAPTPSLFIQCVNVVFRHSGHLGTRPPYPVLAKYIPLSAHPT